MNALLYKEFLRCKFHIASFYTSILIMYGIITLSSAGSDYMITTGKDVYVSYSMVFIYMVFYYYICIRQLLVAEIRENTHLLFLRSMPVSYDTIIISKYLLGGLLIVCYALIPIVFILCVYIPLRRSFSISLVLLTTSLTILLLGVDIYKATAADSYDNKINTLIIVTILLIGIIPKLFGWDIIKIIFNLCKFNNSLSIMALMLSLIVYTLTCIFTLITVRSKSA